MYHVISVAPLADGLLKIELADGRQGLFDVKPFMVSDYFAALKNQQYFEKVSLFFSGVGWPGGQDLGPDTIAAFLIDPCVP
jgi:hypothetical protein